MAEVLWAPKGRSFRVDNDKLLLYSLLEQGIRVEYQCLEGHCGACEVALLSGRVDCDPFYKGRWIHVESANGINPCVCYPASESVVLGPSRME